ncbi:MAG: hypothetical protein Q8M00_01385 [bacterium]|nr:hypothetical protein [bacterium]
MEEENKKLEFLKKQRIRTMQKDIAKLKGEEISDLEPEREEIKRVEEIKEIVEEKAKEKEEIEIKRRTAEEEEKKKQEELLAEKKAAGQAEAEREITEEEKRKKAAEEEEGRRKEKILAKKTEGQRLTDIDKEIENIGLKKGALDKEKKQFLTEIKSFGTQLEPILKEEAVIENKIREVEELEKKASPEKKSQVEKKRWETDARRRDIEKAKWLILEEIEKVEEKIKDIESKYQETSSEEEQFKKEKEEILQKRREGELIRERARLKNEIFQLNDEKKIIENRKNELSAKKDNLETELGKVLNEEKITEEVIQDMEAKEKETSDPKEQRRIEKERWKVDDDRKNLERKKWELEKEKKELSAELKKVELEYQVMLEKENILKGRLKESNRSLKISPEEELPTKETHPEEKTTTQVEEERIKFEEGKPSSLPIAEAREKEEEERERRRLIKEEMKKRIAEEAERRQEEMLWKERRKFLADNQIEAGEEGPSPEDSEIKKEAPETFISILPPKPSLLEKILIRTTIIAILLLIIGFFYWLFAVEKVELFKEKIIPIEEEMPPIPPAEEEIIEKPEILIPASLISVNATEPVEIANSSEIPALLPQLLGKTFETEGHARILFKNINENKVVGLKEFFEAFEIKTPEGLLEKLNNDFTLFVYSDKKANRLGFITKVEGENLVNLMLSWEATMEKDTEKLFEVLGREKADTFLSFKEATYKNISVRYISFPSDNFGICWATYGDKFLFTSSGESIIRSIDKLIS